MMFREVEGSAAVIVESGVFKQTTVFARAGFLYAKSGAGYVRLYADGSTTKAKCRLDVLHTDGPLYRDALGRLCDNTAIGAKPLGDEGQRLLEVGK